MVPAARGGSEKLETWDSTENAGYGDGREGKVRGGRAARAEDRENVPNIS